MYFFNLKFKCIKILFCCRIGIITDTFPSHNVTISGIKQTIVCTFYYIFHFVFVQCSIFTKIKWHIAVIDVIINEMI